MGCFMDYKAELSFLKSILKNISVSLTVAENGKTPSPRIDKGLREYLEIKDDSEDFFKEPEKYLSANTVYTLTDEFMCGYILLLLPDSEHSVLVIGPFTEKEFTNEDLLLLADKYGLPPRILTQMNKYYANIPVIREKMTLIAMISAFGEKIWGGADSFIFAPLQKASPENYDPVTVPSERRTENASFSIDALEARYETEREIMLAVSQGMTHKAELIMATASTALFEKRSESRLRDIKNYTIILNTLLRKAAEYGSVHPLYIDSISGDFAKKIEEIISSEAAVALQKEMVNKYCQLVKTYSMKNYSFLVQKVLTRIDTDLTADLSLSTQAELLNINPSYLSALFKKETGTTLTEYVNRKRVEHAVYLLNSTNMQIQTIAQYCGIMDVNYFTKIFKKHIGKTPKEYREHSARLAMLK